MPKVSEASDRRWKSRHQRRPNCSTATDGSRQLGRDPSSHYTSSSPRTCCIGGNTSLGHSSHQSSTTKPLYIFFDCETTGPSPLTTDIIEMGAVVAYPSGRRCTFSKLVWTDQQITSAAYAVHGIRNDDLETKVTFPEALEAFCKWIARQMELAGAEAGTKYYPVLVAHNGYPFDYRVLLSNMARHKVDLSWFKRHNVKFADSLQYLRKIRKEGNKVLDADLKVSLKSLHMHFFPDEEYEDHRALPVENLKKLFTRSPLKSLLTSMPTKSLDEQLKDYEMACDKRMLQVMYDITPQQAMRLVECGLSSGRLEELYKAESDFDAAVWE